MGGAGTFVRPALNGFKVCGLGLRPACCVEGHMTMDVERIHGATGGTAAALRGSPSRRCAAAAVHCGRSVGEGSRRGINQALNAAGVEAGDPVEKAGCRCYPEHFAMLE